MTFPSMMIFFHNSAMISILSEELVLLPKNKADSEDMSVCVGKSKMRNLLAR